MSNSPSVLVDTTFLITLYDPKRDGHAVAKKYHKYFIENSVRMLLSTIVISEYQQKESVIDLINSENYIILPFNYEHATETADITFKLGTKTRNLEDSRAEYKDDLKLMGQAQSEGIEYVITADNSTLARYCKKLSSASMFSPKAIILSDGFDTSYFNNGQKKLIEDE